MTNIIKTMPGIISRPAYVADRSRNPLWRLRRAMFGLFVLGCLGLFAIASYYFTIDLPGTSTEQAQASHICLDELQERGSCNARVAVASAAQADADRETIDDLDAVPGVVIDALVATEDQDFFDHRGVNTRGIARAGFQTAKRIVTGSGSLQGGSSITQQLVSERYLDPTKKFDLASKPEEIALSIKLERRLQSEVTCADGISSERCAKNEVLRQYFNTVFYGRGVNGVKSAARVYFDKDITEVNLEEAAFLAGVLRNPGSAEPTNNPDEARRRIDVTLQFMLNQGYITQIELDEAQARMVQNFTNNPELGQPLPNFVDKVSKEGLGEVEFSEFGSEYFVDEVWQQVDAVFPGQRFSGGLKVYTTLDPVAQQAAWTSVTGTIDPNNPELPDAALVSVDGQGLVRALIGGSDFANQPFNFATARGSAGRQPGSTFKTIGLAAAIEDGISVDSLFTAPREIEIPSGYNGVPLGDTWTVGGGRFDDATFPNFINLEQATWSSTNTVFAQLPFAFENGTGPERIAATAGALGINSDFGNPEPSFILGTREVSVIDLAGAYSTFERGGHQIDPRVIERIEDSNGRVICWYPSNGECVDAGTDTPPSLIEGDPAIRRETAQQINQVLRGVINNGTGQRAAIGRPAAGKTGTSQGNRDAWFAGYTCDLTTAVWIGYEDNRNMQNLSNLFPGQLGNSGDIQGGNLPASIWGEYTSQAATSDCQTLDVTSNFSGTVLNTDLVSELQACSVIGLPGELNPDEGVKSDEDVIDPTGPTTSIDPGNEPQPSQIPDQTAPEVVVPEVIVPDRLVPVDPEPAEVVPEVGEVLPASFSFIPFQAQNQNQAQNENPNQGNNNVEIESDCLVPGDGVDKRWVIAGSEGAAPDPSGPVITPPTTNQDFDSTSSSIIDGEDTTTTFDNEFEPSTTLPPDTIEPAPSSTLADSTVPVPEPNPGPGATNAPPLPAPRTTLDETQIPEQGLLPGFGDIRDRLN